MRNMEFYVCNTERGVYDVILLLYPWLIVISSSFVTISCRCCELFICVTERDERLGAFS